MRLSNKTKHIIRDILIVCASIVFAIMLAKSGLILKILATDGLLKPITAIIGGALFTTVFTILPASVGLIEISQTMPAVYVALLGGLGAMVVDVIIASFVRKDISKDLSAIRIKRFSLKWHFISVFHFGFLKWVAFVLGMAVIASPLPDELGLFFIGISKVKAKYLPVLFFIANFIGIYALVSISNALS